LDLKNTLNQLCKGETLSFETAKTIFTQITNAQFNEAQVAAFLTIFNVRPITIDEFNGFKTAMLEVCIPLNFGDIKIMDLCGTGGDHKNTFNISTLSSLVAAATGIKVAKHGNKSVSSNCGSSNVLEYFGVQFSNNEAELKRQLLENNICFLHAPLFHPALKNVAKVRADLGTKTFLNMLGPLVNPARPQVQLAGVFSTQVARLYYYSLQQEGIDFAVIHDLNGYDEISLTAPVKLFTTEGEFILNPADFGLSEGTAEAIYGGEDIESAAKIFNQILEGKGSTAKNNVVAANAGLAISTYKNIPLKEGVEQAMESLLNRKALNILHATIQTA
jgi:anthranilate phosphoribosyltransferase